jgi:site-specific DNA recombinase
VQECFERILGRLVTDPDPSAGAWGHAELGGDPHHDVDLLVGDRDVGRLHRIWDQLFPAEQARILQLLVARVVVRVDGLEISLRVEGIGSLVEEFRLREAAEQQAA